MARPFFNCNSQRYNVNNVESHVAIEIIAKVVRVMATDQDFTNAVTSGQLTEHGSKDGVDNFSGTLTSVCASHVLHTTDRNTICYCGGMSTLLFFSLFLNSNLIGDDRPDNRDTPSFGGDFNWNGPRSRRKREKIGRGHGSGGGARRLLGS